MTKEKLLKLLKQDEKGLSGYIENKGLSYLVRVSPDIAVHGGHQGPGTVVSLWRAYGEMNENGVQPGVKGYQGRLTVKGVLQLIKSFEKNN